MPFPWKKAKVTRFSRLVADLHQSPKRGRSLVVETGFPTSLIDLFVKNRDRLRKSPKRKSSSQIKTPPTHLPSSPPQSFPAPPCNEDLQSPQIDAGKLVVVKGECEKRVAFHATFKIFLMVAVAVSSRNLALWIMMTAFLLVLIEFVGTSFFGFLRPESKTFFLDSRIGKGSLVLKKKWDWEQKSSAKQLVVKQQEAVSSDCCGLIELEDDCIDEIQIAKSKFDSDVVGLETQMKVEEMETRREKTERSRSGRIKRNLIKKFVPKKLRHGKKEVKSNNKDQLGPDMQKMEEIEEGKQRVDDDDESKKQVEEVVDNISTSVQVLMVESEMVENVRKRKSGHVVLILIVIVLAGLVVGGRAVALLLTLLWCLILRYIERIRIC